MNVIFSDQPAAAVGFLYGFADSFLSDENSLETPLSSVVASAVNGIIYGIGAQIISCYLIPKSVKPVLPIVLGMAVLNKYPEIIPEVIKGSQKGVENLLGPSQVYGQNNGLDKLTNIGKEVKEATGELIDAGKESYNNFQNN